MVKLSLYRFEHGDKVCVIDEVTCSESQETKTVFGLLEVALADADKVSSRYGSPSKKLVEKSLSYRLSSEEVENPKVIKNVNYTVPALRRYCTTLIDELNAVTLPEAYYG